MNSGLSSYGLGLVFIVLVSLIWAAASILVQYLYTNQDFDSPFLLTYFGVSLFTVFLPLEWLQQKCKGQSSSISEDYQTISAHDEAPLTSDNGNDRNDHQPTPSTLASEKWSTRDHMRAAAKIAPVWFLSNYSYAASLKYTSITSSTVLASTGSLFTFFFALLCRDEHFSVWKLIGVSLGILGSILTGLHDLDGGSDGGNLDLRLWGDTLGLLSAVGYGGYAVMIRTLCPKDESLMSMQLFLGFVGLFNMIALCPIAIWQSISTGAVSAFVLVALIIKGLLDNVLSDYLWARSVVLTSATVATVGLGLTIPLAFLSDAVLGRRNVWDITSILGALSVLVGFVLVNYGQKKVDGEDRDETQDEAEDHAATSPTILAYSDSTYSDDDTTGFEIT
jgi:solute carrier family 35 protein F5